MATTHKLSPTMQAVLIAAAATSGAARGLAEAIVGNDYRRNRYSRTAQKVYNVYLGARLTEAGKAAAAELAARNAR